MTEQRLLVRLRNAFNISMVLLFVPANLVPLIGMKKKMLAIDDTLGDRAVKIPIFWSTVRDEAWRTRYPLAIGIPCP